MSVLEIVPFGEEHVPSAARLLADVHSAHRHFEPLLPERVDFEQQVVKEFENGSGTAAVTGDEVVGYLIGRRAENAVGAYVWSDIAGQAVREPTLVLDLYAKAATRWTEEGLTRHFVFVPPAPSLLDPWFRISFAISGAVAIRDTTETDSDRMPAGVLVRPSTPADLPDIARLAAVLQAELNAPPSFSGFPVVSEEQHLEEWAGTWDDDRRVHFVAERGGRVVGHVLLERPTAVDLRTPENSVDLSVATTDPAARGSGAGVAMTTHVLAWAREAGCTTMTTDWRISNLLAARFWPRRGFRVAFHRLYRSLP
jgi:ribosomal protein S18 acetylase RimI-like enzyme